MAKVKEKHLVEEVDGKVRINDYLVGKFRALHSKKSIKKALKKGRVLVDGKSASSALWVEEGMKITLLTDNILQQKIYDLELEVVYEDEHLAVINKPAGLVSSGNQFRTLQNALAGSLQECTFEDALNPPKLVHRLDSSTSGLIICAKTARAIQYLGQALEEKRIEKKYIALVQGPLEDEFAIESKIDDKEAITEVKPIETLESRSLGPVTWVELSPKTGRTHQLRIHMSENKTPILGDLIYGNKEKDIKGKGLFLSSMELLFEHPISKETLEIKIPPPKKFKKYWFGLKKRMES